ncbi:DUF4376 domain-containing protein [Pseudoalteromonas aurantia]|uniref:DUF4376 domain-containing protein n=1 Tax=Pseudoalteromonas aurantia 208 TaxID=1314867 RepID=A0ABR9E9H2_9GAMM|nr:hypothetical protein [Pseudoalteromonas aurantia]MBE0367630.1 hypothetical protein [Pseudoalteromonas aurantia 208]
MTQEKINEQAGNQSRAQSSAQSSTELEALVAGTPENTATDHTSEVAIAETSHEVTVHEITYQDVQTKMALRHPRAQIDALLQQAIAQEQANYDAVHAQWLVEVAQTQALIDTAVAHNATNPDEPLVVPELPNEPVIDLALRRACYKSEHVAVDLALATEAEPAKVVFDDDALITYHHPATEAHSAEHIEQVKRERFKAQRAIDVAAITVEVEGLVFDGDETAQTRMARAAVVMDDTESVSWVLADNSQTSVNKAQLVAACKAAGLEQTRFWMNDL